MFQTLSKAMFHPLRFKIMMKLIVGKIIVLIIKLAVYQCC